MESLKSKIIFTIIMALMIILIMPLSIFAANEETVIVKDITEEGKEKYIIYLKDYLNKEFEFAFSNDSTADASTLTFSNSALDTTGAGANNIAYVIVDSTVDSTNASLFENTTYMWVRENGEIKIAAREINIADNITKQELEQVGNTSKVMPIKLEQKVVEDTVSEEGLKKTTTVGIVTLAEEYKNSEYQLIPRPETGANNNFFALAELIEKNEFTDNYTKIKASKEFIELYNQQYNSLEAQNWNNVEEGTILQPEDTKTGDQYILWLKGTDTQDVHFLTSYREEDEEWVKEEIKTVLPYTYDSNALLIALGIVVVAIIAVVIRIKCLKKKEMVK